MLIQLSDWVKGRWIMMSPMLQPCMSPKSLLNSQHWNSLVPVYQEHKDQGCAWFLSRCRRVGKASQSLCIYISLLIISPLQLSGITMNTIKSPDSSAFFSEQRQSYWRRLLSLSYRISILED